MRRASLRLCSTCRGRVPIGKRCPRCAKAGRKRADARRGSARERGYGRSWRRFRDAWLAQHPLCGDRENGESGEHSQCRAAGRAVPATEVDHIRPHRGSGDPAFYDTRNLQSLCHRCHSRKTAREDGAFENPRR